VNPDQTRPSAARPDARRGAEACTIRSTDEMGRRQLSMNATGHRRSRERPTMARITTARLRVSNR